MGILVDLGSMVIGILIGAFLTVCALHPDDWFDAFNDEGGDGDDSAAHTTVERH